MLPLQWSSDDDNRCHQWKESVDLWLTFVSMEPFKHLHFLSCSPTHKYSMLQANWHTDAVIWCITAQSVQSYTQSTKSVDAVRWIDACVNVLISYTMWLKCASNSLPCVQYVVLKGGLHVHCSHQSFICKLRFRIREQFALVLLYIEPFHTKSVAP